MVYVILIIQLLANDIYNNDRDYTFLTSYKLKAIEHWNVIQIVHFTIFTSTYKIDPYIYHIESSQYHTCFNGTLAHCVTVLSFSQLCCIIIYNYYLAWGRVIGGVCCHEKAHLLVRYMLSRDSEHLLSQLAHPRFPFFETNSPIISTLRRGRDMPS